MYNALQNWTASIMVLDLRFKEDFKLSRVNHDGEGVSTVNIGTDELINELSKIYQAKLDYDNHKKTFGELIDSIVLKS